MGFFRQEHWSGLPCPSPGDLPNPGIEPMSLTSPALAGRLFFTSDDSIVILGSPKITSLYLLYIYYYICFYMKKLKNSEWWDQDWTPAVWLLCPTLACSSSRVIHWVCWWWFLLLHLRKMNSVSLHYYVHLGGYVSIGRFCWKLSSGQFLQLFCS